MQPPTSPTLNSATPAAENDLACDNTTLAQRWQAWWRSLSPMRQDRLAALAPLAAVLLFMAAIVAAFWYLRLEEGEREQEALRRDVEYAQQRVRLRLLERQEQLMRIARDLSNHDMALGEFNQRTETLINQYPELQTITWIDGYGRIRASQAAPTVPEQYIRTSGEMLKRIHAKNSTQDGKPSDYKDETSDTFDLTRDLQQPVYTQPVARADNTAPLLQLQVPLNVQGKFSGVVMAEYSTDSLLRYGTPTEVLARYAVTLLDANRQVLAGTPLGPRNHRAPQWLPLSARANAYEVPVSPVGNGLLLRAQAYRTSLGVVGSGLFWLVVVLSAMTVWMLVATWRHARRRMQTQQALVTETNFRRAMENSVLTGMRALDLQGRITYVNAAFCQMTGWSEEDLVGQTAPFPYWPESDMETLRARLFDEINGKTAPGGFQVRVRRKNGSLFDARLYVSPLIDARNQQTGWMTSMTDITEPNRIREQLSASHERFTIVLEALDASVSVAPLGSKELLFANKLYRQWFGSETNGHLQLVAQAGVLPTDNASTDSPDDEDGLMGLPTDALTSAHSKNAEIYLPDLDKWLEVRSRYLSWVDGRLAQMVIATDITPRRRAEEQTARQTERAQSVSRLITMGEMASSVAHELNQPLTAINNYCSGIVSRIHSGQITQETLLTALEKTAHQAQRAGQIIQRIRDFVKKSAPNRQLADAATMVSEAVELADIELRRHNVRLTHYVAARLPPLMADSILIEQVLINLMKNGAESIVQAQRPLAGRCVELRVVPKQIEGQDVIEFSVLDTGQGLPQEVLERLFEAFFSTKQEGMGMGLNLCRSIVESHQGRIAVENIYNGPEVTGCKFSFWLPLAAPDNHATNSVATAPHSTTPKDS
ncbi:MAG: PAS domain S-box protein [Giesbergeria sp.]|nr:PAS domain S-box protein [Giesbergeria sp.]